MLAERFKLAEREVQLGIFVGKATKILRRVLKILHGGSSFCSYRFDNFEHLGRGFTEIRNTFAREHFTVFCATSSSSRETGENNFCTWPIFRPASITGAPTLIPAALSK